jgi:hypothetical protein
MSKANRSSILLPSIPRDRCSEESRDTIPIFIILILPRISLRKESKNRYGVPGFPPDSPDSLLNNPDYFVFDEATSALDTISERLVHDALARVLVGRTAIFIAHRLSTVKNCDRIIVLNDQTIVQDGTFQELRSMPGLFREMVEHDQF